jgi:hypothetical protein
VFACCIAITIGTLICGSPYMTGIDSINRVLRRCTGQKLPSAL